MSIVSVLKVDLDLKQSDVQQQLEKLRQHEQRLIETDEQLRKKELEIDSRVQEAKIETENKYRVRFITKPYSYFVVANFSRLNTVYFRRQVFGRDRSGQTER